MQELFTPTNLERAGLAVSLLFSIWINYKLSRDFSKTISNHVSHFTAVNQKLTDAVEKLISFLERKAKKW